MSPIDPHLKETFDKQGFVGPFRCRAPEKMSRLKNRLRALIDRETYVIQTRMNRHLDLPVVARLTDHPRIKQVATALLGPDLLLWRSMIFDVKAARGLGWHRDEYHAFLERPFAQLAIHVAITTASEDNCMRIVPGSHLFKFDDLQRLGFTYIEGTKTDSYGAPNYWRDAARNPDAVKLTLQAGEFIVFHPCLLHGSADRVGDPAAPQSKPASAPHQVRARPVRPEQTSRLALTMRVTSPDNRVLPAAFQEALPRIDRSVLWAGTDLYGINPLQQWPACAGTPDVPAEL